MLNGATATRCIILRDFQTSASAGFDTSVSHCGASRRRTFGLPPHLGLGTFGPIFYSLHDPRGQQLAAQVLRSISARGLPSSSSDGQHGAKCPVKNIDWRCNRSIDRATSERYVRICAFACDLCMASWNCLPVRSHLYDRCTLTNPGPTSKRYVHLLYECVQLIVCSISLRLNVWARWTPVKY